MPVVTDSFYGNDFDFRQQLRSRALGYAAQVEPTTVVWNADPNVPVVRRNTIGRPRVHPSLEDLPKPKDLLALAKGLPDSGWRNVTWREGSRGPQRSRFAMGGAWMAGAEASGAGA